MISHIEPSRTATGFAHVTFEDRNGFTSQESIDATDLTQIAAALGLVIAHPSQLRPPQLVDICRHCYNPVTEHAYECIGDAAHDGKAADEAAARASVRHHIEWERQHYGSHTRPQLSDIQ